jgi:HAD superfamily hydrolase (TIGR01509 family)
LGYDVCKEGGVASEPVDFDSLIGQWRAALESAQGALRLAGGDLPSDELRRRSQRLVQERRDTVGLLDAVARERGAKQALVRLVASSWEAKRLLALPADVEACVFNVDGVLVGSAAIHAQAWRQTFDEFEYRWIERTGEAFPPFTVTVDYPTLIHGKPRADAVRDLLASRGIALPEGTPGDPPGAVTVQGLARRKNELLHRYLREGNVHSYEGARLYLELAHDAGVRCGVVSGSTNTRALLERARLAALVDDYVDGVTVAEEHLHRKPSPEMLLASCRHLGVDPRHTAVFETTRDGVAAGRAGGFEVVVAVEHEGDPRALVAEGADRVVADLGDLIEQAVAG